MNTKKGDVFMNSTVTTYENITLITLHNVPADIGYIADVFTKIAAMDIDVDMISIAPSQSTTTSVSFTINDDDLIKTISFTSGLEDGCVKSVVSSANCKISVDDNGMVGCPGVAAKVFSAVAGSQTEIRLVTTSETQISILVTREDFDAAYAAVKEACK